MKNNQPIIESEAISDLVFWPSLAIVICCFIYFNFQEWKEKEETKRLEMQIKNNKLEQTSNL